MKGYPRSFRLTLLNTAAALFLSGLFLLPTTLVMRLEWNGVWRLGANARIGMAALHVLCAFVAIALFGSLWAIHMRAGWRQRRNHRNGSVLVCLLAVLVVTGLGIFYLADETMSLYAALAHAGVGLALPVSFIYHMLAGRKLARYTHRQHHAEARLLPAAKKELRPSRHRARSEIARRFSLRARRAQ